ncbi:hypothetical protein [Lusitaniella coriacea]|nr:hypothetical protein [Lusitaniella coriacea]
MTYSRDELKAALSSIVALRSGYFVDILFAVDTTTKTGSINL